MDLSSRSHAEFGKGFSVNNLEHFRDFYLTYSDLIDHGKSHAVRGKLTDTSATDDLGIPHAPRGKSDTARRKSNLTKPGEIQHAVRGEFWKPGRLHPNLSWTHYRTLLRHRNCRSGQRQQRRGASGGLYRQRPGGLRRRGLRQPRRSALRFGRPDRKAFRKLSIGRRYRQSPAVAPARNRPVHPRPDAAALLGVGHGLRGRCPTRSLSARVSRN